MDLCHFLITLLSFFVYVECQPVPYSTTLKQACGDKLVDMMQLVCGERGYNPTFRSQEKVRRIRRGIVEECCRRSCSQEILELYCRPEEPQSPSSVQKRKRSDNDKSWFSDENQIVNSNEETMASTESPNFVGQIYNKEATQRSILKSLDHRIPQSSREDETNSLGVILNTRPVSDPIRHWHSKKNLQRHQTNKVPANNADEDKSAAFQIGVQKPYYSFRKQSRPRNHHSYPH